MVKYMTAEEVQKYVGSGKFQLMLLLIAGVALMADSMETTLLSFISQCVEVEWNLSSAQKSSIASSVFFGELFGSFFWGQMADLYGRKPIFVICCIILTTFGVLTALSDSLIWLITCQLIVGFSIGGFVVPFDILAEFLPASDRGIFLIGIEYFWFLGSIFIVFMAWLVLGSYSWRVLAIVAATPLLISTLCTYFVPESPEWLLTSGGPSKAPYKWQNFTTWLRPDKQNDVPMNDVEEASDAVGIDESKRLFWSERRARALAIYRLVGKWNGRELPPDLVLVDKRLAGTQSETGGDNEPETPLVGTIAHEHTHLQPPEEPLRSPPTAPARESTLLLGAGTGGGTSGEGYSTGSDNSHGDIADTDIEIDDASTGVGYWGELGEGEDSGMDATVHHKSGTVLSLVTDPALRRTTLLLWVVWATVGLCYYGFVLLIARLLSDDGINSNSNEEDSSSSSCSFDYSTLLVSSSAEVVGVSLLLFASTRLDRKTAQAAFSIAAGASLLCVGAVYTYGRDMGLSTTTSSSSNSILGGVDVHTVVLDVCVFCSRAFLMASFCMVWVFTVELYPTYIRSTGHSVGSAWSRIGAGLSPYLVDSEQISILGIFAVMCLLAVAGGISALYLGEAKYRDVDSHDRLNLNVDTDYRAVPTLSTGKKADIEAEAEARAASLGRSYRPELSREDVSTVVVASSPAIGTAKGATMGGGAMV